MKQDLDSLSMTFYSALTPAGAGGVARAVAGVGGGMTVAEPRGARSGRQAPNARRQARIEHRGLHDPRVAARVSGGAAVVLPGMAGSLGHADHFPGRRLGRSARLHAAQRWAGIGLATSAWMLLLLGLAYLVMATLHNRDEELGLGIDATARGAWVCLASLVLAVVGIPLWIRAERLLRAR